jgi:hypothetical protein
MNIITHQSPTHRIRAQFKNGKNDSGLIEAPPQREVQQYNAIKGM